MHKKKRGHFYIAVINDLIIRRQLGGKNYVGLSAKCKKSKMRDRKRKGDSGGRDGTQRKKEREALMGKQAVQLAVLGMPPELEHVDWKKDKEWKMLSGVRHDSLFADLAGYPSINPSIHHFIHQSTMKYFNSTHFSPRSPICASSLALSIIVRWQWQSAALLHPRTRWKLRCMSSVYPSISGERPRWHAITQWQHLALQTIYTTKATRWVMATHGEALEKWGKQNWSVTKKLTDNLFSVCPQFFLHKVCLFWGRLKNLLVLLESIS